ncbi:hypothetical protein ACFX2J_003327 [Malus domestica]
MAGREVLLNSVTLAIPTYPMSCFKFLMAICNFLNGALSTFWWGESKTGNKMQWKAWKDHCVAKDKRGMGVETWNTSTMLFLPSNAGGCGKILMLYGFRF